MKIIDYIDKILKFNKTNCIGLYNLLKYEFYRRMIEFDLSHKTKTPENEFYKRMIEFYRLYEIETPKSHKPKPKEDYPINDLNIYTRR